MNHSLFDLDLDKEGSIYLRTIIVSNNVSSSFSMMIFFLFGLFVFCSFYWFCALLFFIVVIFIVIATMVVLFKLCV